MLPHATAPGYRRSRPPRSPASRNGTGRVQFANRAGCGTVSLKRQTPILDGPLEQAGPAAWGELVTCDELAHVPAAWAARGEPTSAARGWAAGCFRREGTPDNRPNRRPRTRRSAGPAGRDPRRGITVEVGREPRHGPRSPHAHQNSAQVSWLGLEKGGALIREPPGGGLSSAHWHWQWQFQLEVARPRVSGIIRRPGTWALSGWILEARLT
jgi:hypothetical protein